MIRSISYLGLALVLTACGNDAPATPDYVSDARRIANSSIIVDTHVDVPYRLLTEPAEIAQATGTGDFDYPRAVAGGLNAPFMSIYTPASYEALGKSRETAEELIDVVESIVASAPDKFAVADSVSDVRAQFKAGIMSLPLGMENGSPIEGDLANLAYFHERGIRYLSLAHSLSNHLSDSSYDEKKLWNGLSDVGKAAIREMNRLGIMIDVSHVSDEAFWQIVELTETPIIASHSSARHFTPGFERNMSDEMIVALAKTGGVIQINFGSTFISQTSIEWRARSKKAQTEFKAANKKADEAALEAFSEEWSKEHPFPYASVDDVANHIDRVVQLVGIDHVGFGSDFDGVGDSLPTNLKDAAAYPSLIKVLLQRGYTDEDIAKVCSGNLMRVWLAQNSSH